LSLTDQLLTAFANYGLPALFGFVLLGSVGLPIPGSVLLVAAGALVQQGEMDLRWVIALVSIAAILGDQIGYGIGRFGGRRLVDGVARRLGGERHLARAEALARRWGGFGIFVSRWLLTPLGSALNLASGMAAYPYLRFLACDATGELLWAAEYVLLGALLSDRVADLIALLGNLSWLLVGLVGAAVFGWLLLGLLRSGRR
jgi:membrane protein DedA with SNARE-associated domain